MVREGKGQVVCIAHLTAVGRNVCPAPAVIHGMYKLEEETKKKKSQGSKKRNGRRISSCTATGRSYPPRKIMQVFFFLSLSPSFLSR